MQLSRVRILATGLLKRALDALNNAVGLAFVILYTVLAFWLLWTAIGSVWAGNWTVLELVVVLFLVSFWLVPLMIVIEPVREWFRMRRYRRSLSAHQRRVSGDGT
jgi:hypothetical protein